MPHDTCILYYHGNDYDGVSARQRYLMEALAPFAQIFYLDGATDKKWRVARRKISERFTVIRGLAAALGSFDRHRMQTPARVFGAYHLRTLLRPFARVIFWNAENWLQPYRFIAHDELVYDCIDPPFNTDPLALREYQTKETAILAAAKTVFATADRLADECREHHCNVHLLNNACEPAEYAPELLAATPRPAWWPADPRPIIGFMGSLDWRIDFAMLHSVCAALPELHFILAGTRLAAFETRIQALEALPNVLCPGRLSVADGRYLLDRMTVGLIPYTPGDMNDCINPVKLYAHALLGKPTVGTDIRELTSRPEIARTGGSAEQIISAIKRAVVQASNPAQVQALKDFAAENTWKNRAQSAAQILGLTPNATVHHVHAMA